MKIEKVKINNFRSLKNFKIDLEENMSLIIGKNNTGKTSFIEVLNKFLNSEKFESEDFNLEYIKELENNLEDDNYQFVNQGISLKIFIKYDENDNLRNISNFLTTLDVENNYIILGFEYILIEEAFMKMKEKYKEYKLKSEKGFEYFFKHNQRKFFKIVKKSIEYDIASADEKEDTFIILENKEKEIKKVISMKQISAKRAVDNKDSNKTLSIQSSNYYEKIKDNPEIEQTLNEFREEVEKADQKFDLNYKNIFKGVVDKVKEFGGLKKDEFDIEIKSLLSEGNILKGNTTVLYSYKNQSKLPEYYNGLGYMNLISIIFEIEILINEFCKEDNVADINLLFIEEPEAHTHPQMQYIFIKNIKNLLEKYKKDKKINLQTVITTHSSHIVSQSEFSDIKYFNRLDENGTWCKNLKDLEKEYIDEKESYKFLKQYLTLNKAEIFFADKIILIEGDTERILLPAMLKKMDLECQDEEKFLSQNISIVEIGRFSKIFEKFIDFIQIKTLIISDIDSTQKSISKKGKTTYKSCRVEDANAIRTSNESLRFFFNIKNDDNSLNVIKAIHIKDRILKKENDVWKKDENGIVMFQYQQKEESVNYYPRSFEDAFICINRSFIDESYESLKNKHILDEQVDDFYRIATECVESKPSFAIEILLKSDENYSNWKIPQYIKEGLEWLKK